VLHVSRVQRHYHAHLLIWASCHYLLSIGILTWDTCCLVLQGHTRTAQRTSGRLHPRRMRAWFTCFSYCRGMIIKSDLNHRVPVCRVEFLEGRCCARALNLRWHVIPACSGTHREEILAYFQAAMIRPHFQQVRVSARSCRRPCGRLKPVCDVQVAGFICELKHLEHICLVPALFQRRNAQLAQPVLVLHAAQATRQSTLGGPWTT
jgi:hypothetical protein